MKHNKIILRGKNLVDKKRQIKREHIYKPIQLNFYRAHIEYEKVHAGFRGISRKTCLQYTSLSVASVLLDIDRVRTLLYLEKYFPCISLFEMSLKFHC